MVGFWVLWKVLVLGMLLMWFVYVVDWIDINIVDVLMLEQGLVNVGFRWVEVIVVYW